MRVCKYCLDRQNVNTTAQENLPEGASGSPGGPGIPRHWLTVPNAQHSGSRSSLHSETHSSASTPGAIRSRLRTSSVFGSQGITRNIQQEGDIGTGNDSPITTSRGFEKRQRKISAPSSLQPFRIAHTTDLDSPMEENEGESNRNVPRKPSFIVSSTDFPKNSRKLRVLMKQIASGSNGNGIPLETYKYAQKPYYSCFLGRHLIEWLQKRDTNTQFETALAIGQALLDFKYLQDVSVMQVSQFPISSKVEFSEEKPYRPDLMKINLEEVLNPATSFLSPATLHPPVSRKITILQDASLPTSAMELHIEKSACSQTSTEEDEEPVDGPEWFKDLISTDAKIGPVSIPNTIDISASSENSNDALDDYNNKEVKSKKDSGTGFGQDLPDFPKSSAITDNLNVDGIDCPEMDEVYLTHQKEYIARLIKEENLSEKWISPIVEYTTRIVRNMKIEFNCGDNMDIREHVKIKRIPGGAIEDSVIVNGEVFSGRVVRRGMPLTLTNPNLLLISESIGYPRHDKLVSLENLQAQQDEYVKNVVNKLKSFKPDVILSESGICNGTQDGLHNANIAVILKVKSKVLQRVERLFHTIAINSLDSTHQAPPTSTCYRYSNKSYILNNSTRRNYIVLEQAEEMKSMRGCTVLLRGGSSSELSSVKRVLKRMLLVKQSAKYEKAFLLTEYCQTDRFQQNNISFKNYPLIQMTLSPFVKIPELKKSKKDTMVQKENKELLPDISRPAKDIDYAKNIKDGKILPDRNKQDNADNERNIQDSKKQYICKKDEKLKGKLAYVNSSTASTEKPEFITTILTSGLEDRKVRNMLADFRASSSSRFVNSNEKIKANNNNEKGIRHHDLDTNSSIPDYYKGLEEKKLPLVYSSHSPVSQVSPQYCVKPWVTGMAFYGIHDIPIGAYLEDFCFNDDEKCPHVDCTSPLKDHIRRFVLEDVCVTLKVQEAEENMMVLNCSSESIQTWRYCNE